MKDYAELEKRLRDLLRAYEPNMLPHDCATLSAAADAVAALKGIEADVEDYLQHTGEFSTLGGQRLLRAVREPLLSRERASELRGDQLEQSVADAAAETEE